MGKLEENNSPIITIRYKLSKPEDESFEPKFAPDAEWPDYHDNGTFNKTFEEPAVNRLLVLHSPYGAVWVTDPVDQILEHTDNYVLFNTAFGSLYKLEKIGSAL